MFTGLKINVAEARRIRKSAEVVAELKRRADKIRAAAGPDDHEVETYQGTSRARVTVRTSTFRGRSLEATRNNLSGSLDAGRG